MTIIEACGDTVRRARHRDGIETIMAGARTS